MYQCIKEKTFSLNDTIKYSIHDLKTKTDTKDEALWNSTLTTVFLGYCHSFTFPQSLKADMIADALVFGLDGALDYRVFLHDPLYHHFVSNPLVFPRLWREYRQAGPPPCPGLVRGIPSPVFCLLLAGSLWHKGAYNRTFPCIEANYPYAIKNQRGAEPRWTSTNGWRTLYVLP